MNALQRLFLQFVITWMDYDIQLERRRLQACKDAIAHDQARVEYWKRQLMELEANI